MGTLYGVRVRQRRDAAFFPNYFGQICFSMQSNLQSKMPCVQSKIRNYAVQKSQVKDASMKLYTEQININV